MAWRFNCVIGMTVCLSLPPTYGDTNRFKGLLERNPFEPWRPPQVAKAVPPPPYELRGILVEDGVQYFSLHNLETKKSVWVRKDRPGEGLNLTGYDEIKGVLALDFQGTPLHLTLKNFNSVGPNAGRSRASSTTGIAQLSGPAQPTVMANERERISQLEERIRQRREARAQRNQKASS